MAKTATTEMPSMESVEKAMKDNMAKAAKSFDDMASFSKESIEAMVKSANVAAKTAEEFSAEMLAFSKKSVEDSMAAAKGMTEVKSVNELVEKQAAFAKSAFDAYVAQATKISEMLVASAKEASQPLNTRMTAVTDMMKTFKIAA